MDLDSNLNLHTEDQNSNSVNVSVHMVFKIHAIVNIFYTLVFVISAVAVLVLK